MGGEHPRRGKATRKGRSLAKWGISRCNMLKGWLGRPSSMLHFRVGEERKNDCGPQSTLDRNGRGAYSGGRKEILMKETREGKGRT